MRRFPFRLLLLGVLLALGCKDTTAPSLEPPYIAIVSIFTSDGDTDLGRQYTYRVTEISGSLGFDRTIHAAPHDTIIVPVQPATYRITVEGVPSYCQFQGGGSSEYYVLVPPESNTSLVRYQITCESLFTLTTGTDGSQPDAAYVYQILGDGVDRSGIVEATDTVRIDDLVPGRYEVRLGHVANNCVVTSGQGPRPHLTIAPGGGARADFRILCADPASRPTIVSVVASYHDGTSGFRIRAVDPQGDIERYAWDITDCGGRSVLPGGGRLRRGLLQAQALPGDTITIYGAIEPGLPDSLFRAGHCTSLRVADQYDNSTPVFEVPLGGPATGPSGVAINARFLNTSSLETRITAGAAGVHGFFAAALLRDGVLFPPDGAPDLGVFNTLGYDDVLIPTVPLGGGRPQYYDYYAVITYLFDAAGNFTRLQDDDLFN